LFSRIVGSEIAYSKRIASGIRRAQPIHQEFEETGLTEEEINALLSEATEEAG
jgi:hypothetical protein